MGGAQHLGAAGSVQREHLDRERAEGLDGLGDRVGDVVELQVEEDIEAHVGDFAHIVRTVGGEHLKADFHPAQLAAQLVEDRGGGFAGRDIKGEDQIAGHRGGPPLMDTIEHESKREMWEDFSSEAEAEACIAG